MIDDISTCTWSGYDREGFLAIQAEALAEGDHGMTPFHQLSPGGMDHRPVDPDGRKGELCFRIVRGPEGFVFQLNDARTEHALPNLNKGATRIFDTGTFQGQPFHFTIELDPLAEQLDVKSWRAGGKYRFENIEGLVIEHDGTTVTITGATSVELGGTLALAVAQLVDAQLQALLLAVQNAAASEAAATGLGGMTALAAALSGWPQTTAATITKGA